MNANYDSVRGRVSATLGGARSSNGKLFKNFRDLVTSPTIVDLLMEIRAAICRDKRVLKSLAAQSYQHENGFAKVTILEDELNRFRLRLHCWRSGDFSQESGNIHNHRFHCVSHVFRGSLRDVVWQFDDEGAVYNHHRYYPRSGAEQYLLAYVCTARLGPVRRVDHQSGDTYSMRNDRLHTSHQLESDTITLFMEDRSVLGPYADVFSQRYPCNDLHLSSPSMDKECFVETFSYILSRIDSSSSLLDG
jgi:hypothetical protein